MTQVVWSQNNIDTSPPQEQLIFTLRFIIRSPMNFFKKLYFLLIFTITMIKFNGTFYHPRLHI